MAVDTYREMVKSSNPATEAEVAERMIRILVDEGWDCYPEVTFWKLFASKRKELGDLHVGNGVCDIVAVKAGLVMILECKKTFSLDLIEQGLEWTRIAPLVALVVPSMAINTKRVLKDHLMEHFGLGLFGVTKTDCYTNWHRRPRLLRQNLKNVPIIISVLTEAMKSSIAGSQHTWRQTPYEEVMSHVRRLLVQLGPQRLKDIFERIEAENLHHYSSRSSLRSSIGHSIRIGDEPDLTIGDDKLLRWDPERCRNGEKYIRHIQEWAGRCGSISAARA